MNRNKGFLIQALPFLIRKLIILPIDLAER